MVVVVVVVVPERREVPLHNTHKLDQRLSGSVLVTKQPYLLRSRLSLCIFRSKGWWDNHRLVLPMMHHALACSFSSLAAFRRSLKRCIRIAYNLKSSYAENKETIKSFSMEDYTRSSPYRTLNSVVLVNWMVK